MSTRIRTIATTEPNSEQPPNEKNNPLFDVLICGAGPGGLMLASNLAKEGCRVGIVDPVLDKPWPNNYGVWMDEAEPFGYSECVDRIWNEVGVIFDEQNDLVLNRPYGRIDRTRLKSRLTSECSDHGVKFCTARATDLVHLDDAPSTVTIRGSSGGGGGEQEGTLSAFLVVDATGFSRKFVKHKEEFNPGYQVTYGARFAVEDLGPYTEDRMVLMDYSETHLYDDGEMVKSNDRFPSFLYAMPLGPNELFLEETILVSRPGGSSRDLQARLEKRMASLGITPTKILEDERAAIPMGGADPIVPQRTLGFGATASLVHPASGYMVARAMEIAPRVAASLAPHVLRLRSQAEEGRDLEKGALDELSAVGWGTVWPADERRQRDFMHFGFELLCLLNPQELRDFFTGFFRLPDALWEHFLSWRLSGIGHVVMGLRVWAQCIPRRFMPVMLVKSLPFIANRLVLPFASRGPLEPLDKVYWDAQSGMPERWEPGAYFKYLETLRSRNFSGTNTVDAVEKVAMAVEAVETATQRKETVV